MIHLVTGTVHSDPFQVFQKKWVKVLSQRVVDNLQPGQDVGVELNKVFELEKLLAGVIHQLVFAENAIKKASCVVIKDDAVIDFDVELNNSMLPVLVLDDTSEITVIETIEGIPAICEYLWNKIDGWVETIAETSGAWGVKNGTKGEYLAALRGVLNGPDLVFKDYNDGYLKDLVFKRHAYYAPGTPGQVAARRDYVNVLFAYTVEAA